MPGKTAVLRDHLFIEHDPGYGHPESPERLLAIYRAIDQLSDPSGLFFPDFAPASHADLALNHGWGYIERVAETAERQFAALDADTHTSPRSYDAACLAAGAVIEGLKLISSGGAENAFALVRPPGHHAEADHSSGFCLFNNIAVGARYALKQLGMERILIIDWDLHHGNGTQHSFYDSASVLYCSTHQYPYFPGSGALMETGRSKGEGYTVNVPLPGGQGDEDFVRIFIELIAPLARLYRPDCIMVSAGYDIHADDPLGSMRVSIDGFARLTAILTELAAELCGGRLLLVLEGGYDLAGLSGGVMASLGVMSGTVSERADLSAPAKGKGKPLAPLDNALAVAKTYWKL